LARRQHDRPQTRLPSGQAAGAAPPPQSMSQSCGLAHRTRQRPFAHETSQAPLHATSQSAALSQLTWLPGPTEAVQRSFTHSHETLQRSLHPTSHRRAPSHRAVQSWSQATEQASFFCAQLKVQLETAWLQAW
jgi:hypothetical protein